DLGRRRNRYVSSGADGRVGRRVARDPAVGVRPRLIATDLDGTLLRRDGTLSQATRAALARAKAAGVEVVVLTARPPRYLGVVAGTGVSVAACANGAIIYDLDAERMVEVRPLPLAAAQRVAAAIIAAAAPLGGVGLAVETGERLVFEPGYTRQ